MTDFGKFVDPATKELREILSPEGVEERIVSERVYQITLTQGAKYRVYFINDGERNPVARIFETKEEAEKDLAKSMLLMASLEIDPQRTIEVILKDLKKQPKGEASWPQTPSSRRARRPTAGPR